MLFHRCELHLDCRRDNESHFLVRGECNLLLLAGCLGQPAQHSQALVHALSSKVLNSTTVASKDRKS